MSAHQNEGVPAESRSFATTHWSVVLAASDKDATVAQVALARLCRVYWYPLYAYVRRQGYGVADAQDLTQDFFVRLLEKEYLRLARRDRGRFRTFMLTSLKHFLINEHKKSRAAKRGGDQVLWALDGENAERRLQTEPADQWTPEKAFEKRWAMTLLEQVLQRMRREAEAAGNGAQFHLLKEQLWGPGQSLSHAEMGRLLGMNEGSVKVAVHRLRRRFADILRAEIAHTVSDPAEIELELRHLMQVVGF